MRSGVELTTTENRSHQSGKPRVLLTPRKGPWLHIVDTKIDIWPQKLRLAWEKYQNYHHLSYIEMEDLRASNHYRRAGDLYLRRRTCVGRGRGATHWVDRVGICGRLFLGLIIYTLEFRWYNFESKNRDMPSISRFKFIVTIRNIFQQRKVKYQIKNWIFLTTTTKMAAVMSEKNE